MFDVADAAAAAKIGPGLDPTTELGPLVSQEQFDRVNGYIQQGLADGARALTGGKRWGDEGYFIEPTIFAGAAPDARIATEEIFGPVLSVIPFDDVADAVRIANDSPYGLSGTVFSGDDERAAAVAARLRVGTVNVNGGVWYSADMPFGGYKQSGIGREMGLAGFEEYLEIKAIATAAQ